ncbi:MULTISPECIES: nucleotidyltransferase substrate binding protein [Psychrilyobacter]|uniref:Nucleotidyltransferase n=1 Tax=Psychrilyobacter piezotolerans TaxID=2293438 RepID=A0ABX9KD84_9FUSO|nr:MULTISPECIES: nucleotidyltransferase substrate binding protein [Psychrilyobacter]MCS5422940.1 nucleotidyltransferase substrate binding protein [Psychrilyobacter sp. S5]NDI79158.1 nucleotidyltransferase [Psychrilyobacter piezotolerans]RDE58929.1 nucleotidyltransferase [Psychrilyobacter sp. S5]REI39480.1 nucleotidyltransferase [Psychrilyobacter piezotolerans]
MAKRWDERISDYKNALERLNEAIEESKTINSSTIRDGVIQRFEFTLELSWKVMKYFLNSEGLTEAKAPKSTIRAGFNNEVIKNAKLWIDMIEDRNLTTHTYSQSTSDEIYEKIIHSYYKELKVFYLNMKDKEVE